MPTPDAYSNKQIFIIIIKHVHAIVVHSIVI